MKISDRQLAGILLKAFAESSLHSFAPSGFYDDDAEFMSEVASAASLTEDVKFRRRIFRIANRLSQAGILYGEMRSTHKEYIDEPSRQRCFHWENPGYAARIQDPPRHYKHLILGQERGPKYELEYLLNKAFLQPQRKDHET